MLWLRKNVSQCIPAGLPERFGELAHASKDVKHPAACIYFIEALKILERLIVNRTSQRGHIGTLSSSWPSSCPDIGFSSSLVAT